MQLCDHCTMVQSIIPLPKKTVLAMAAVGPKPPTPIVVEQQQVQSASSSSSQKQGTKQRDITPLETFQDVYRRIRTASQIPAFPWVDRLKDALDVFQNSCMLCTTESKSARYHGINGCPQLGTAQGSTSQYATTRQHYLESWRYKLRYGDRKAGERPVCYKCHLPNGPSDCLHPKFAKETKCPYPDVVSLVGYRVLTTPPVFKAAQGHFGETWPSTPHFVAWATQSSAVYPTNLLALFAWYYERYFSQ